MLKVTLDFDVDDLLRKTPGAMVGGYPKFVHKLCAGPEDDQK